MSESHDIVLHFLLWSENIPEMYCTVKVKKLMRKLANFHLCKKKKNGLEFSTASKECVQTDDRDRTVTSRSSYHP